MFAHTRRFIRARFSTPGSAAAAATTTTTAATTAATTTAAAAATSGAPRHAKTTALHAQQGVQVPTLSNFLRP